MSVWLPCVCILLIVNLIVLAICCLGGRSSQALADSVSASTRTCMPTPTSVAKKNLCPSLSSTSGWDATNSCIDRGAIKIITVSHGAASDTFWNAVEDAVLRAGRDLRINSIYRGMRGSTYDLQDMAKMINEAIDERPHGLIVSNPEDAKCLDESLKVADGCYGIQTAIKAAVKAGIPVMMINSVRFF